MAGKEIAYYKPSDLFISGIDTESDASNDPLFDERIFLSENENLVRNIAFYGIQLPVVIRQDGDRMFVVDGRQRVRAARIAAERQAAAGEAVIRVPCVTVMASDRRAQGIMISTNENRLNDDVLTKAIKAARLLDQWGDITEICTAFGRNEQTINNWVKLASADESVHEAIKAGKISASAAVELAKLPRGEQAAALEEKLKAPRLVDRPASARSDDDGEESEEGGEDNVQRVRLGVKRAWMKKAIDSKVFDALDDDKKEVLQWFATGEAQTGSWVDEFEFAVASELKERERVRQENREFKLLPEDEQKQIKAERKEARRIARAEAKAAKDAQKQAVKDAKKEARRQEREAKKAAEPAKVVRVVTTVNEEGEEVEVERVIEVDSEEMTAEERTAYLAQKRAEREAKRAEIDRRRAEAIANGKPFPGRPRKVDVQPEQDADAADADAYDAAAQADADADADSDSVSDSSDSEE